VNSIKLKKVSILGSLIIFLLLLAMPINRISLDIGFRIIPIYAMLPFLFLPLLWKSSIKFPNFTSIEKAIFLFYLYASMTSLYSEHPEGSFRFLLGISLITITYLTVRYHISLHLSSLDKMLLLSSKVFIVGSLLNYLLGLSVMNVLAEHVDFFGVTIEKRIPRMIGLNNDPNICAFACMIFFFFFLFKNGVQNKLFAAVSFFCVIATLSRGGLAALVIGLLSIVVIMSGRKKLHFVFFILILSCTLGVLIFYNYELLQPFIEKRTKGIETGGGRFEIWQNALIAIESKPIFGYGIFTFREVMGDAFNDARHAHNTYLEVLLETGVIGFVLYLFCLSFILISSLKLARKYTECRFLFPSNIAVFVAMFGLSMYLNPIFWFLLLLNSLYIILMSSKNNQLRTNIVRTINR
jgi:O-antigen ligase